MDKPAASHYLMCKDYTVSGELFALVRDEELQMLRTVPAPAEDRLPEYYKSENYISHTDGKRSLFEKCYHMVKRYALKQKLKYINRENPEKGRLLDIGAGTGDFLLVAKADGWQAEGIEPNTSARKRAKEKGISLREESDEVFMEDRSGAYTSITLWHVLEHVPDLHRQISELKILLKREGTLFVAVPNFRSYDAEHYKSFWAAYDVPRHLWHFSPEAIKAVFQQHDMKVIRQIPMKFDAFYVSLLSEKYKTGKMNFLKAFRLGWRSNRKAASSGQYSSLIYVIKHANT
ncbi:class I SAM-dependent methyltransferase [Sinomicrobium soli]|uniref:class I SAM-dependent methyltransferase n=1 Tax=Sinomicrobium sp. N-1-3-6 TaxID=2219864 RepID=UPI000DCB1E28|nr:class I SAM-dependent methyltransferase [Sinomicrobium sp. N-1-3-6]RAV29363.1 methyltransferase [Sinomicrobium sp. N-1-3-6]